MSEPTTGRPAPAGRKILGMDRRVVLIVGLAAAGGIAYFLWKRHKQGAAGSAATTSTAATTTYTTDSTNSIAALQTEIEDLQQALASKGTSGTTATTGSTSGGTTGTTSTTGPGTGGGKPGAPRAVKVKSKTSSSFTITWEGPIVKAKVSSYVVEITHQGKHVASGTRDGSSDHQLTVGGLKGGTSYGVRVAAVNSAGQGPWSSVIYGTTDRSGGGRETVNPGGPNKPAK
jgi:cytoskeletal protein RodZ